MNTTAIENQEIKKIKPNQGSDKGKEDWVECTLGEILTIERGGSPRPIKEYLTQDVNGVNWIKIGDATNSGKYILKTLEKIKPTGLKNSREVFPGDLLLSNSMSFGRPYIMGIRGAIHDGWLVIRDSKYVDKDFLYYEFSSPLIFNQFSQKAKGSTVKNLNIGLVSDVKMNLIPLPIQRAIVRKIEELFSSLDSGIADLKKAQEQLVIYRQAVLKKAFEGELTKEWREKQIQNRTPQEYHWMNVKLGDVLKVSSGKGLTSKKMSGKGYPVYGGNGISGYHSEYIFVERKLIIGRVGVKCGVTHITEKKSWVTDNALIVSLLNSESFDLRFLQLKLQFENLNKLSNSTAQPVISGSKIYSYKVNLPQIREQHAIVREIESRLSVCDKVEESITESLEKAQALRQSILKKAFEGKLLSNAEIEQCKREEDYEPASVLLERIKAEKKK